MLVDPNESILDALAFWVVAGLMYANRDKYRMLLRIFSESENER